MQGLWEKVWQTIPQLHFFSFTDNTKSTTLFRGTPFSFNTCPFEIYSAQEKTDFWKYKPVAIVGHYDNDLCTETWPISDVKQVHHYVTVPYHHHHILTFERWLVSDMPWVTELQTICHQVFEVWEMSSFFFFFFCIPLLMEVIHLFFMKWTAYATIFNSLPLAATFPLWGLAQCSLCFHVTIQWYGCQCWVF